MPAVKIEAFLMSLESCQVSQKQHNRVFLKQIRKI